LSQLFGDYPVIAGAVSGPSKQPKNEAESDRWLKSDTKSGISAGGVPKDRYGVELLTNISILDAQ
jgi:hypothetical protein